VPSGQSIISVVAIRFSSETFKIPHVFGSLSLVSTMPNPTTAFNTSSSQSVSLSLPEMLHSSADILAAQVGEDRALVLVVGMCRAIINTAGTESQSPLSAHQCLARLVKEVEEEEVEDFQLLGSLFTENEDDRYTLILRGEGLPTNPWLWISYIKVISSPYSEHEGKDQLISFNLSTHIVLPHGKAGETLGLAAVEYVMATWGIASLELPKEELCLERGEALEEKSGGGQVDKESGDESDRENTAQIGSHDKTSEEESEKSQRFVAFPLSAFPPSDQPYLDIRHPVVMKSSLLTPPVLAAQLLAVSLFSYKILAALRVAEAFLQSGLGIEIDGQILHSILEDLEARNMLYSD